MPTTHLGRAIGVNVHGDEDGFVLTIQTDQGEFAVNVHACSEQLLEEVQREIGAYWQEAQSAMASAKILRPVGAFVCDPDESCGHSLHADYWDSRSR